MKDYIKVKIAGYNDKDTLLLSRDLGWECGSITNGVSVRFDGESAGFVMDFKSLKKAIAQIEEGSQPVTKETK